MLTSFIRSTRNLVSYNNPNGIDISDSPDGNNNNTNFKTTYRKVQKIVYETISDPPEGYRTGEIVTSLILLLIVMNIIVGVLETEDTLYDNAPDFFYYFEFFSVVVFTIEYILTIWSCTVLERYKNDNCLMGRIKAMIRPLAIVDVISIAPFYLNLVLPKGTVDLRFMRILRLARLFRLFRHGHTSRAFMVLGDVIVTQKQQLGLGMSILLLNVLLCSSIMYIIESESSFASTTKFTSIPATMWWGVVTMTTIGYGDMAPESVLGKVFGSFVGYLGICVIALPVGIIGAGFTNYMNEKIRLEELMKEQQELMNLNTSSMGSRGDAKNNSMNTTTTSFELEHRKQQLHRLKMALASIESAIRVTEDSISLEEEALRNYHSYHTNNFHDNNNSSSQIRRRHISSNSFRESKTSLSGMKMLNSIILQESKREGGFDLVPTNSPTNSLHNNNRNNNDTTLPMMNSMNSNNHNDASKSMLVVNEEIEENDVSEDRIVKEEEEEEELEKSPSSFTSNDRYHQDTINHNNSSISSFHSHNSNNSERRKKRNHDVNSNNVKPCPTCGRLYL